MAQVFFPLCPPLYHIVRVLPSCPSIPRPPGQFRSVVCYQKDNQKADKCTRGARPCLSLSFDLPSHRADAKLLEHALPCGRCPQGCTSRYAIADSLQLPWAITRCIGLACLARRHTIHGSALRYLRMLMASFDRPLSPAWSPRHAITTGCPVALIVLRLGKASLGSLSPRIVIASARPQYDGLQALASLPN